MSVACDFCNRLAERHDELLFIAAPSGMSHICEECIGACADVIAARQAEEQKE